MSGTASPKPAPFGVICDASDIWKTLPALESVVLTGAISLGAMALPKLRRLALQSGALPKGAVVDVCAADLEIWTGHEWGEGLADALVAYYGGDVTVAHLAPILDGGRFPALKRLRLMNSEFGDALCQAVVSAAVLPRLKVFDLAMGVMTDEGGKRVARQRRPPQTPSAERLRLLLGRHRHGACSHARHG